MSDRLVVKRCMQTLCLYLYLLRVAVHKMHMLPPDFWIVKLFGNASLVVGSRCKVERG